eukprot:6188009-Pleurochrysis_carterae.AAC.3
MLRSVAMEKDSPVYFQMTCAHFEQSGCTMRVRQRGFLRNAFATSLATRSETEAAIEWRKSLLLLLGRSCSARAVSHIACVSPTKRSVSATSGREKVAIPCEKAGESHHPLGTAATSAPMTPFHTSGAVPIPTLESPAMPNAAPTVAPSGNGHDQTGRSPTSVADASEGSRKKRTHRVFEPA